MLRVIGLVRNKYTILQSTIPIDYLHCNPDSVPTIDKIATVACALTNLCESVVPFDYCKLLKYEIYVYRHLQNNIKKKKERKRKKNKTTESGQEAR